MAHLTSMRVRTVSTETEMEMLRAQVSGLGAEYKELRATLMRLQDEQRRLKAALDPAPVQSEAEPPRSRWSRFRHWIGMNHE
jgi:predicted RNase H-like nuclease (RuvC/YqgF family)